LSNNLYDERFLAGVRYFNETDFFAAHEHWEDLWKDYQGPLREFYQGLIQVAVCLHHFGNGNVHGARKLYHSSTAYLQPYRPYQDGVDLDQLVSELTVYCQAILDPEIESPVLKIETGSLPKIDLNPAPAEPPARP